MLPRNCTPLYRCLSGDGSFFALYVSIYCRSENLVPLRSRTALYQRLPEDGCPSLYRTTLSTRNLPIYYLRRETVWPSTVDSSEIVGSLHRTTLFIPDLCNYCLCCGQLMCGHLGCCWPPSLPASLSLSLTPLRRLLRIVPPTLLLLLSLLGSDVGIFIGAFSRLAPLSIF